jgi:AcrR family transcriptional regulator
MYIAMDMKARSYDMSTRSEAKSATRDAIIKAAVDTFVTERSWAITLPVVADRAGVTVKTVLRHFGNREGLIDAACSQSFQETAAERAPTGDAEVALSLLIAHYERRGDVALILSNAGDDDARLRGMADSGRLLHRGWVEEVFSARLPESRSERSRVIDVLVVATDVYAWKLLRRDRGLSVENVRDRLHFMIEAILAEHPSTRGSGAEREAP